ncbi:type II toxin-antitoxin system Phd/YefM family antitoxin [Streptomyces cyaneofuscatus]|uniref:type II toxin-antitoxin system Phd/YefM family antitoxin n=1 Tax=Streptomyces cyaneofuscatus TaxID=66883 RepID=UPI00341B8A19
MEASRRDNVHEARTRFSRIVEQVAPGKEVVISEAGEPVAEAVPLRPTRRTGRGSPAGGIHIADDFDELPDDIADAFGTATPSTGYWSPRPRPKA